MIKWCFSTAWYEHNWVFCWAKAGTWYLYLILFWSSFVASSPKADVRLTTDWFERIVTVPHFTFPSYHSSHILVSTDLFLITGEIATGKTTLWSVEEVQTLLGRKTIKMMSSSIAMMTSYIEGVLYLQ